MPMLLLPLVRCYGNIQVQSGIRGVWPWPGRHREEEWDRKAFNGATWLRPES